MTSCAVSVVKNVVLDITRKPAALARRTASTASSNTPSLHTDSSWRSRSPSMCTIHAKLRGGVPPPRKVAGRREFVRVFGHQPRVRTQQQIFLACEQLPPDLVDLGMH